MARARRGWGLGKRKTARIREEGFGSNEPVPCGCSSSTVPKPSVVVLLLKLAQYHAIGADTESDGISPRPCPLARSSFILSVRWQSSSTSVLVRG